MMTKTEGQCQRNLKGSQANASKCKRNNKITQRSRSENLA